MRQALIAVGDRMLSSVVPQARAGACPCSPGEKLYQKRCKGIYLQTRTCTLKCDCTYASCTAWVTKNKDCGT